MACIDVELAAGWVTLDPEVPFACPADLSRGAWVITAYNPAANRVDAATNAARQAELAAELRSALVAHPGGETRPAVGRNASGSWQEPSFAVSGLPEPAVLALARRFGQDAVFRIDAEGIEIVPAEEPP